MRRYLFAFLALAGLILWAAPPAQARNHGGIYTSLQVPALEHNQLEAYDNARDDIVALARTLLPVDAEAQEYARYADAARDTCGVCSLLPITWVASEYSPWHLPAHAMLAPASALMQRLELLKGENLQVQALRLRLIADGGTPLCLYSNVTFDTARTVGPDWSRPRKLLDDHPEMPTGILALAALGILLYGKSRLRSPRRRLA